MVSMILYMAMYMRNVPNIEGAINFASKNVTGPIALELRKMMWDLEIRKYVSIYDALMTYTKKWEKNREFVDAVEILVTSQQQAGKRRLEMLDEAVQVILEGYREQSRHFNQKLKLPVAVVHALGILLPVLGLVLFPIVAVFLNVKAIVLFVGYNIILPFILLFVISNILETRPVTYSKIDISENPDVPPKGKFRFKNKDLPAWPFGFVVGAVVFIIGLVVFLIEGTGGVLSPVLMTGSVAFGVSVYYILLSRKRLQVRQETREIEDEFAEALFQIGSQVQSGAPVEMSLEMSLKRIGNMKIKKMFNVALKNIRTLGMTFDQAFFDKKYGAVYFFPSKLIKSVIHTVVETTKKGVSVASLAMLSVSKYLKGIHETQEEVQEGLSDTVNSLKFQSFFLSPFISGVIVTMAIVIIQILGELSIRLGDSSLGGGVAGVPFGIPFGQISITPFEFVIIVAIYMIESSFILSYFINGIENGDDPIGRQDTTAYTLLIGFIVFSLSLFITLGIFGPLIIGSFA
jgi:Flp pilus assembly protein TadB